MHLYKVQKGKHYFKGYKWQLTILQYSLTLLGIVTASVFGNWWYALGTLVVFLIFVSIISVKLQSESIRAYFSPMCAYQISENYDQVNKLFGFSEGFHHWNSARIGWRCTDGRLIELVAYCYIDGVRVIKPMIKCRTEAWVFCNIQNKSGKYVFKALSPNQSITVSVDKSKKLSIYSFFKLFMYKLYPYFGGKIAAPQDMSIYITKLTL